MARVQERLENAQGTTGEKVEAMQEVRVEVDKMREEMNKMNMENAIKEGMMNK